MLFDPKSFGPAGSPSVFGGLSNPLAEFGFIAGSRPRRHGRHHRSHRRRVPPSRHHGPVATGAVPGAYPRRALDPRPARRHRLRRPVPRDRASQERRSRSHVDYNGVNIPVHLDQAQLESWFLQHPDRAVFAFVNGPPPQAANVPSAIEQQHLDDLRELFERRAQPAQSDGKRDVQDRAVDRARHDHRVHRRAGPRLPSRSADSDDGADDRP